MSKLELLHSQIIKEQRRIEMLKTTKGLDVDFLRNSVKESKLKIERLQEDFNNEYKHQNN